MASRVIQRLNRTLDDSYGIHGYYTKNYLDDINRTINITESDAVELRDIDMYYSIEKYELFDSSDNNSKFLSNQSKRMVNTFVSLQKCFTHTIYNSPKSGLRVFFGANRQYAPALKDALGNLKSPHITNVWIHPDELERVQQHNGLIVGVCALEPSDIDTLINTFESKSFIVNILCVPCDINHIHNEINNADEHENLLQQVARTDISLGTLRPMRINADRSEITNIVDTIKKTKERLRACLLSGAWKVIVHIASSERREYEQLSSAVAALFKSRGATENDVISPRVINISFPVVNKSIWLYPKAFFGSAYIDGANRHSLVNLLDSNTTASLVVPPLHSHKGYYSVRHLGESSVSVGAFDQFAPKTQTSDSFVFGLLDNGNEYFFPLGDLRQHAFISGATQYGKSTSVQQILKEAHKQKIPFVVIEAAKKDYWKLTREYGMNKIPVYSVGMDARKLYINPFQPEDNTLLDFHIQSVINALLSMFVQDDPLPQILNRLVYRCYEKKGWVTSQRVSAKDSREYPILSDLLTNLDECIDSIGYSEDVKRDMKGVVNVRISSLIRQVGSLFNTQNNISIKDMFTTSAIVELDDFDEVSKPFIASILAMKANEYTRQCNMEGKLRRLLVIEEAHHILPNPDLRSSSPNSLRCSNYFSNMLAEVSAYGTGIIIVDQRASIIAASALANTGTKIIHNVRQSSDIEEISCSMSLKEHEKPLLSQLGVGQAIISLPQTPEICRINVRANNGKPSVSNLGCLFCNMTDCSNVSAMLSSYEDDYIEDNGIDLSSMQHCAESMEDRHSATLSADEKICLVGRLVTKHATNVQIARQRLYDYCELLSESEDINDNEKS